MCDRESPGARQQSGAGLLIQKTYRPLIRRPLVPLMRGAGTARPDLSRSAGVLVTARRWRGPREFNPSPSGSYPFGISRWPHKSYSPCPRSNRLSASRSGTALISILASASKWLPHGGTLLQGPILECPVRDTRLSMVLHFHLGLNRALAVVASRENHYGF